MSKNEFLIDIFENPEVVIKMYISEISKSKISDQKAQKMTILWTLKVGSLIMEHPVLYVYFLYMTNYYSNFILCN